MSHARSLHEAIVHRDAMRRQARLALGEFRDHLRPTRIVGNRLPGLRDIGRDWRGFRSHTGVPTAGVLAGVVIGGFAIGMALLRKRATRARNDSYKA